MSRVIPYLILASVGGVVFAQAEVVRTGTPVDVWLQGGAFGVLAYVIFHLLKFTLPSQQRQMDNARLEFRETLDKMSERHERWERARHEDSTTLSATLGSLSRTCARVHDLVFDGSGKNKTDEHVGK